MLEIYIVIKNYVKHLLSVNFNKEDFTENSGLKMLV